MGCYDVSLTVTNTSLTLTDTETKPCYIRIVEEGSGQIPIWIYISLIAFNVGLIAYTFHDTENRIYGNIISGIFATILSFLLAILSIINKVGYWTSTIASTAYNSTTGITAYTYTDHWYTFQDPSLMWLWILVGIVLGIFSILFLIEAVMESRIEKEGIA